MVIREQAYEPRQGLGERRCREKNQVKHFQFENAIMIPNILFDDSNTELETL